MGEGSASVLWLTPAGLSELVGECEVVKGLVLKLERMNLEMQERLRSKVDLLTSDASAEEELSKYHSWTCQESTAQRRCMSVKPSAPQESGATHGDLVRDRLNLKGGSGEGCRVRRWN